MSQMGRRSTPTRPQGARGDGSKVSEAGGIQRECKGPEAGQLGRMRAQFSPSQALSAIDRRDFAGPAAPQAAAATRSPREGKFAIAVQDQGGSLPPPSSPPPSSFPSRFHAYPLVHLFSLGVTRHTTCRC
eukprot:CAMPEP_0173399262 /NCGR_PEP_ID=MMETSP1356-20130122/44426_1 /TAXON_ID=77927 ORGANISM="Hemiselmis virescens, Strain PCC157" /NCGR_SAMPLE_ID=MMETSP1356 /ASSEMBLY_ACC=CAM_ASM_000847 /LENGTH=129 /DNA_ID=CAMNT_0014358945 /DNA_START=31 /DNA_END=417 /DNA_ORIENTATION=+